MMKKHRVQFESEDLLTIARALKIAYQGIINDQTASPSERAMEAADYLKVFAKVYQFTKKHDYPEEKKS